MSQPPHGQHPQYQQHGEYAQQYVQQPYPPHYAPAAPPRPSNGMGTAGFVLGLLAVVFAWIPIIGVIGWPLSILGLVFSLLGLAKVRKGRATNRGLTIAGVVLSIIALLVCIIWVAGISSYANSTSTGTVSGPPAAAAPAPAGGGTSVGDTAAFGQTFTFGDGLAVRIDAPKPFRPSQTAYPPASQVERAVALTVTITNGSQQPFQVNTVGHGPRVISGGQAAQEITDIGNKELDTATMTTVLPGKSFSYTKAHAVTKDPGELQAEWTRELLSPAVIFTGQG